MKEIGFSWSATDVSVWRPFVFRVRDIDYIDWLAQNDAVFEFLGILDKCLV